MASPVTISDFPASLQSYKRTAYIPVVSEGDGAPGDSKFSGRPWLGKGQRWPVCTECHRPLQLFLQLDLGKLPGPAGEYGSGLLQLFYCTQVNEDCSAPGYQPFAPGHLVRVVEPDGRPSQHGAPAGAFPAFAITGWEAVEDFPQVQELQEAGIELPEGFDEEVLNTSQYPQRGAKLGGYPDWVQGVEYPHCPLCGTQMRLLFQLDADSHLPFDFGDCATGHVTQCPNHKNVVAFGWACC